jgi:hypothetical protein
MPRRFLLVAGEHQVYRPDEPSALMLEVRLCGHLTRRSMMKVELGCLTRPWGKFSVEQSLAGIAGAGFKTCGFGLSHLDKPLISDATEDADIARLKAMLTSNGLKAQALLANTSISSC